MPNNNFSHLTKYEPSLDGLRACAVTSVVAFHVSPELFPGGWVGVDLFFVLSGYLITSVLRNEIAHSGGIDLKSFYMRRILRLTPAFWAMLAFVFATTFVLSSNRADSLLAVLIFGLYVMNWNLALSLFPKGQLEHTWSLAMEEQFYLFWPLALLFISHREPLRWIVMTIVAITIWRAFLVCSAANPDRIYFAFDTRADALLIGCGLALLPISLRAAAAARVSVAIPVAGMIVMVASAVSGNPITDILGLTLASLGSAWLIVGALQSGWLQKLLSARPLVYTGRVSYGWYLWHVPLLGLSWKVHLLQNMCGKIILVAIAFLFASISYHFIELPFLRIRRKFNSERCTAPVCKSHVQPSLALKPRVRAYNQ